MRLEINPTPLSRLLVATSRSFLVSSDVEPGANYGKSGQYTGNESGGNESPAASQSLGAVWCFSKERPADGGTLLVVLDLEVANDTKGKT